MSIPRGVVASLLITNLLVSRSSGIVISGTVNVSASGRYSLTVIERSFVKGLKNVLLSKCMFYAVMTFCRVGT